MTVQFPGMFYATDAVAPDLAPAEAQAVIDGRSRWQKWWSWQGLLFRQRLGQFLSWLGVPGFVQAWEYDDLLTGWHLSIRVSPLFTVISVEGRDFYFYRRNGKFDGTGMGMCDWAKLCEKRSQRSADA